MNEDPIIQSDEVKLAIYLKINQLKREQLDSISYSHVLKVLYHSIWKNELPFSIHEAVDDIMKLDVKDVVSALHTLAMIEGSKLGLDKIEELLGGN